MEKAEKYAAPMMETVCVHTEDCMVISDGEGGNGENFDDLLGAGTSGISADFGDS